MNPHRFFAVFGLELRSHLRKPNLWILVVFLVLLSWGLSLGEVRISSGDSSVGGQKAWITSQFAMAYVLSTMVFMFYSFFVAVLAGMALIRDDELKVGQVLHATPLSPGEYAWGKFTAACTAFAGVLSLHLLAAAFFNHAMPNSAAADIRGPFLLGSYLVPALVFGLPPILFVAGTCFAIGERARRPILVFVLPLAAVIFTGFFLWNWSPTWLDPRLNRLLMLLDPSGFRWLNETWLKVDRGVKFYNEGRIGFDVPFLLSRLAFCAVGLLAVASSQKHLASSLRGAGKLPRKGKRAVVLPALAADASPLPQPLAALRMTMRPPSFLRGALESARVDFRELLFSPGLYLFVPIIIIQSTNAFITTGALEAPILVTPGLAAGRMMNTLTLLICLLLTFYTVESLWRDRATGLGSVVYASPVRSSAFLLGKALANGLVGAAILLAALATCAIAILVQGKVSFSITPFAVLWGGLLLPTFLAWTAFVSALFAVTRSRYGTYGLALAVVAATLYFQFRGKMNWVGNWDLWDSVRWSDMGPLEMDRPAIVLNRLFVLGLFVLFLGVAVRFFPRTTKDPSLLFANLRPSALWKSALKASPLILVPAILGTALYIQVDRGTEAGAAKKKAKDYWKQNLASWKDVPLPDIKAVELDLRLEPERSSFSARGSYVLENGKADPMSRFPLTAGPHWKDIKWTLDGKPIKPEDRTGLFIIEPPAPMSPGGRVTVGFSYRGRLPDGISKNGGGMEEFILPCGAVLTSFSPSFVPVLGYIEEMGVDKENSYEPKVYPEDFWKGKTEPLFGGPSAFTTRVTVTVPEAYRANSVGVLARDEVKGAWRTLEWRSDQPVRFFNVVAGKWAVRRGEGTAVYYHPAHTYNIAEMVSALDGARKYYGQWFYPYPWQELKLSEFADMARYAQGFPTNITFSEGIGFLTKDDPRANTAFAIAAHESAHQWWGNILTPGKGPGGNVLAEGLSHCSAALLVEQLRGPLPAMEFRKRIEEKYANVRRPDAERPMVKVDGSKDGDQTVTYDKGGWVFWMLVDLMGRDEAYAGFHEFVGLYKDGPDFPVIQDFLAVMRNHAPDPAKFDAFTKQWFYDVVVPEYRITEAARTKKGDFWEVRIKVKNEGKGTMPLTLAAAKGDRMDDKGAAKPGYRDARQTITLGPGEEREAAISCAFEPDRALVDPDARVLQLNRNKAIRRF